MKTNLRKLSMDQVKDWNRIKEFLDSNGPTYSKDIAIKLGISPRRASFICSVQNGKGLVDKTKPYKKGGTTIPSLWSLPT